MPFIHQHPHWPAFTWSDAALAASLAQVRHTQGRLLGRMESLGFTLRTEANLSILISDVVKTSAIEGELLNPQEVRSSIASRLGLDTAGLPRPARHVEGIVELMLDATQNASEPLTADRLARWQTLLFPHLLRHPNPIPWRTDDTGPMHVVSGPLGHEKIHFTAPDAPRLDQEMQRFLDWFNAGGAIDPVLKSGIAHLWFVTIHPFEDGNGRIARAIADMLLARADGISERFYSMSSQIEAERSDYYRKLESTQRGNLDITDWLSWFLACLGRAIQNAEHQLAATLHKAELWQRINQHPINERQRAIINRLLDNFRGHLTTSKYAKLAKCSPDTALRDIRELLSRGILIQNEGAGRSTSYRLSTPDGLERNLNEK